MAPLFYSVDIFRPFLERLFISTGVPAVADGTIAAIAAARELG
ncbi:MAG TPA: hypothetical protein VMX75_11040 [Spirochaetia bacterium]|nr:hypothetical protein [Spirochaetia bacterium]